MVWNSPELSFDLSPPAASSRCIPDFLTRFPAAGIWDSDDLTKLNDFIHGLENELTKIQAFTRELPLSVLLLNDAIGKLKEEARKRGERIRREGKLDESVGAKLGNDKKTWMSSAQLWSPTNEDQDDRSPEGGAFLSFREEDSGLSLLTPGFNTPAIVEPGSRRAGPGQAAKPPLHQTARKLRRCWSPDLHRRFVDALEQLGGSQVATPKQIRELMQVDGLTNDEVKSHLQKYRLHIRKLPASSRTTPSSLNDIAIGQGRLELSRSKMDLLHSSSPEGPLHLGRSGKCNSTSIEDQHNDDDDNNNDNWEGHSWNI